MWGELSSEWASCLLNVGRVVLGRVFFGASCLGASCLWGELSVIPAPCFVSVVCKHFDSCREYLNECHKIKNII